MTFYSSSGAEVCVPALVIHPLLINPSHSNNWPNNCSLSWRNTQTPGPESRIYWSDRPFRRQRSVPWPLGGMAEIGELTCPIAIQYIGLQILEKLINTRWRSLPDGQRQGLSYSFTHFIHSLNATCLGRHPELRCQRHRQDCIRRDYSSARTDASP